MSRKNYTIDVGAGKFADDCTIEHMSYGMEIQLNGVRPSDLYELLEMDEIIDNLDLAKAIKKLVDKHGLGEVMAELADCASSEDIAKELYEIDRDAVVQCVTDNISE